MKKNMISMNRIHISFLAALSKLAKQAFFACTFILLTGCATEPAQTAFYNAPDLEPAALASIIGARAVSGYTGDKTTYLAAVDGLPIENAKTNFSYEVKAAPGYRALTVVCAQDSLLATSEITTELKAGHVYTLKAEKIPLDNAAQKSAQRDELYNIWIEESLTQEVVGVKHLAKLNVIANNISNSANDISNSTINDAAGDFLIKLVDVILDAMIDTVLAPDNTRSANNAGVNSYRPAGSVESTPIKQPTSPVVQNPRPGKALTTDDGLQGKMKRP